MKNMNYALTNSIQIKITVFLLRIRFSAAFHRKNKLEKKLYASSQKFSSPFKSNKFSFKSL